jgi:hypothetical protein
VILSGLLALDAVCLLLIMIVYWMTRPLPPTDGQPKPKAPSRVAFYFVPTVIALAGVNVLLWASAREVGPPADGYCAAAARCCAKLHGKAPSCAGVGPLPGDSDCKVAYQRWVQNAKDMLETCD